MEHSGQSEHVITAREAGLVACRRCARVWPMGQGACDRCGGSLSSRDAKSLQRVWGFWLAGLICYIPANIYPMLDSKTLFSDSSSTIVGGAVDLIHHGSVGIAIVILVASVVIPVGKFLAVAFLALSVKRSSILHSRHRHGLYEVVEYVGRWSMVDVFVVAILSSLVQLDTVASIKPGPASLTFALSVIFTMLAAQSLDSRLIWDESRS